MLERKQDRNNMSLKQMTDDASVDVGPGSLITRVAQERGSIAHCELLSYESSALVGDTHKVTFYDEPVGGREPQTADSGRCSLTARSVPIGHIVIIPYSFILNSLQTLKGKEVPRSADMNQPFWLNCRLLVNDAQSTRGSRTR